jgi:hypothetical protein
LGAQVIDILNPKNWIIRNSVNLKLLEIPLTFIS